MNTWSAATIGRSRRGRWLHCLLAMVALLALTQTGQPSAQAAVTPPAASPQPEIPLPPELDLIDEYQGQVLCDPTDKVGTRMLRDTLWRTFRSDIWTGLSRNCSASDSGISEHKDGRAIDWGVSVRNGTKSIGDEFFAWVTANNGENARRLGIMYIIWDSRMWRLYDMGRGFTDYRSCVSQYTRNA